MRIREAMAYALAKMIGPENMLRAYDIAADRQMKELVERELKKGSTRFQKRVGELEAAFQKHLEGLEDETERVLKEAVDGKLKEKIIAYLESDEFKGHYRSILHQILKEGLKIAYPVLVYGSEEFDKYKDGKDIVGPIEQVHLCVTPPFSTYIRMGDVADVKKDALKELKLEAKRAGANLVKIVKIVDDNDTPIDFEKLKNETVEDYHGVHYIAELYLNKSLINELATAS